MPTNPFSNVAKADPLAPTAGTGAWGQGAAGFGTNQSAYGTTDEYDVVEIEPPAAKPSKGAAGNAAGDPRGRDLARKEAELQKREADLQRREAALRAAGVNLDPFARKNFPPCFPILHHDISTDIPDGKKSVMRMGMFIYFGLVTALVYNLICVLVAWGDVGGTSFISAFFFAIVYVVTGVPGAWWLWYIPLYKAMMKDGALSFAWFFCFFLVHIGFCIYVAVAPTWSSGSTSHVYSNAGLLTALDLNNGNYNLSFIFFIVGFAVWAALAAISVIYLLRVYATFRNQGGVSGARAEATVAGVQMAQKDMQSQAARNARNGR